MTAEKKAKIEVLAQDLFEKKWTFEMLGYQNVYGKDKDTEKKISVDYSLAKAEMIEADALLNNEMLTR